MRIPISVHTSYVLLSTQDYKNLFKKENFIIQKHLPQKEENVYSHTVDIKSGNKEIKKLRIYSISNNKTRIFLTNQDAYNINLSNNSGCNIISQTTNIYIQESVQIMIPILRICTHDAKYLGIKQNQTINIIINKKIIKDIKVKIKDNYILDLILPYDIAKTNNILDQSRGEIIIFS